LENTDTPINILPLKTKKDNILNIPIIKKRNGRRQTFGEIEEMEDKMEQTQQDIPLLTNDNAREDTRENNPFSHS